MGWAPFTGSISPPGFTKPQQSSYYDEVDFNILDVDFVEEEPELTEIEIGPFGKVDHILRDHVFEDTWKDNNGTVNVRRIALPAGNFEIVSVGALVYRYCDGVGSWHGSEQIRRGRA